MCEGPKRTSIDIATPRNVHLSAFYKRSFAYHTLQERYPVILTQLIDNLVRNKHEIAAEHGKGADKDLKEAIGEISKLKYEIQTNKPMTNLTCGDCSSPAPDDLKFYNDYLKEESERIGQPLDWYNSKWLHNECYMHRRLRHIFEKTNTLKNFDHYKFKKEEAFSKSQTQYSIAGTFLLDLMNSKGKYDVKEKFLELLKMNLWGNKCDLSFSNGKLDFDTEQLSFLAKLDPFIVINDSEKIWNALSNSSSPLSENKTADKHTVDIVLDNTGYELFTDFCVADYLISNNLATKIRFYVKSIPWYISDVTTSDYHWTLRQLGNSESKALQELSKRWLEYTDKKVFTVEVHNFWTLPVGFPGMEKVDPELYKKLGEAKCIFFKGDLNYRKLFDDINWEPTVTSSVGMQGFNPGKLCSLRTVKSDVLCGLKEGVMEEIEAKTPDWANTGDYGVIVFADNKGCAANT